MLNAIINGMYICTRRICSVDVSACLPQAMDKIMPVAAAELPM